MNRRIMLEVEKSIIEMEKNIEIAKLYLKRKNGENNMDEMSIAETAGVTRLRVRRVTGDLLRTAYAAMREDIIKASSSENMTEEEIANALGISTSVVMNVLYGVPYREGGYTYGGTNDTEEM